MAIQFDPVAKLIKITSGTSITALELYNAAMDWCDDQSAMGYSVPMAAYGKFGMGSGVYSDSIFVLLNGWKIKLYDGTYQFTITGTIITDDETARTTSPDSGNVEVVFQVSTQGTIVVQGSGITQQDKEDIADEVWAHTTGLTLTQRIQIIKQVEANRWKINNNQFVVYDDDGITPLLTFNLKDKGGQPSESEVFERVPV